jgi:hypothetical protein
MSYGKVSVGGTCLATYHVLAAVSAEFKKRYPNIQIDIDMGAFGKANLIERMKKHSLDLLIGHKFSPQLYETTPILEERYVIAMQKNYPGAEKLLDYAITKDELFQKTYPEEKEIEDMSIFNEIEFLNITRSSTPGVKMQQILGNYSVTKYSVKNARHAGMQYNMMRFGLGALMISDINVKMFSAYSDDLIFFVPKSENSKQLLYIARDITQEPTAAAINFKKITIEICKKGNLF